MYLHSFFPFPSQISNGSGFAFGLATVVGLIPEILMLVYMGTTMHDLTSIATGDFEFGVWQKVFAQNTYF